MSGGTREIVDELLGRMAAGDHERTAELFAEPIDWQLDWPEGEQPAVPWIRKRSSRADVADHFRSLAQHHVPELNATSISRILVDGPDAVILGTIAQTTLAGTAYTAAFALHLTVDGGLITRFHIY
ncbi:MAG TPA: nuclear transport factor 2 family protein, partial [Actinoplanes sp.]|nr:nuclear transport factor 2 family protein [Actinoplanes sp.]